MSDRKALALELAGTPQRSPREALADELRATWDEAVQAQQPLTPAPHIDVGTDPATFGRRRVPDDLEGGIDRALQPTALSTRQLGSTALVTGGTMAGATLGGMTGPFAPVAVPVFSAIGGEAGNVASKWLGWQPGAWNEPDLSDALALGVPLVAGAPGMARAALPYTRAGRAVQTATEATAAQDAAYLAQVAADRGRLAADGSVLPVAPRPTPVQPAPIHMPDKWHMLSELGLGSAFTPYLGALGGAKVTGGLFLADSAEAAISKALLSPTLRPWLLRQLEASGGTLTPQTLATLSAVGRGGALPAEPGTP